MHETKYTFPFSCATQKRYFPESPNRNSLAIQWLRLSALSLLRAWVESLVRDLGSCKLLDQKKNTPNQNKINQESLTSSAHLQDLHVDLVGFCQLHAIDLNVLKGRNFIGLGCLLQATYHLVHSGSLPCPRDPGDVHAPGVREDPGLGLCSCVTLSSVMSMRIYAEGRTPEIWRWEE